MTSLLPRGEALFSPCGVYRYRLTRQIDGHSVQSARTATFIMLNPSTADADQDDPTIRRCISFARSWGCPRLIVANIFAIRATDPKVMLAHNQPVGPYNNVNIIAAAEQAKGGFVVCAWGAHGAHRGRSAEVLAMLDAIGSRPMCLGTTASGQPRHPLYVKGSTELQRFGP